MPTLFHTALPLAAALDLDQLLVAITVHLDAIQADLKGNNQEGVREAVAAIDCLVSQDTEIASGTDVDLLQELARWIEALRLFAGRYLGGTLPADEARRHFHLLRKAFPVRHGVDEPLVVVEADFIERARVAREALDGLVSGEVKAEPPPAEDALPFADKDFDVVDLTGPELAAVDPGEVAKSLAINLSRQLRQSPTGFTLIVEVSLEKSLFERFGFALWVELKKGDLTPFVGRTLLLRNVSLRRQVRMTVQQAARLALNIAWETIARAP